MLIGRMMAHEMDIPLPRDCRRLLLETPMSDPALSARVDWRWHHALPTRHVSRIWFASR